MANGIAELLHADLEHFGESLWRNDEIGERRFNFFLTLATSVIGGLAALYAAKEDTFDEVTLLYVTRAALTGLLIFGGMTYLRLLQRDRVTDEYHATLRDIRNRLARLDSGALDLAVRDYKMLQDPPKKAALKWRKGGLAQMAGVMTGVLLALLVYSFVPEATDITCRVALAAGAGIVLAVVLVHMAIR